MQEVIEKARVLIEALPYIQRFRGQEVVVKFGGSIMEHEESVRAILKDIAFMECVGLRPVIVHGGGKAISARFRERGLATTFLQGLRVTDEAAAAVVEEVLNREVNPRLVEMLQACECKARGIHGEDILRAVRREGRDPETGEPMDWGYVGEVDGVDAEPVAAFCGSEMVPVITPLGRGPDGRIYNINADDAAAAVAIALRARKLVFLSDVPGLLENPDDPSTVISTVHRREVDPLIRRGVVAGGMQPKLLGCVRALEAGVGKVHLIDAAMPHSLLLELFTDRGVGTEIVP